MVSQFLGRGKTTAWRAWKAFPEVTESFIKLSWSREILTKDFEIIELFAVLMYGRNSPHKTVDKCRKHLFTHKIRTMDNCPPAQDALLQHVGWECHSQTYGCVAWHWTKLIKTWQIQVGLWMTKASSSQYGQHYQKHHKHTKNWNIPPVKGFVSGTVIRVKNTTFQVQIYAAAKDNVKTRLTIYVWWLLLCCKLTKHHPLVI